MTRHQVSRKWRANARTHWISFHNWNSMKMRLVRMDLLKRGHHVEITAVGRCRLAELSERKALRMPTHRTSHAIPSDA